MSKRDLERQQVLLDDLQQASNTSIQPVIEWPAAHRALSTSADVAGARVLYGVVLQLAADYWQLARQAGKRSGKEADKQRIREEYAESVSLSQPTR